VFDNCLLLSDYDVDEDDNGGGGGFMNCPIVQMCRVGDRCISAGMVHGPFETLRKLTFKYIFKCHFRRTDMSLNDDI